MKLRHFLFLPALFTIGLICYFLNQTPPPPQQPSLAPTDHGFFQRAYPYGKLDGQAFFQSQAFRQNKLQTRSGGTQEWTFCGPLNINGRLTDIEGRTDDVNTLFVGTASGGVFKTTDAGNTWISIFDDAMSLSVGDMAMAPSNEDIMYVGTGEANAGGGSLAYDGVGVYKSIDGGDNWTYSGLPDAGSIGRVIVHPTNPDIAYVGCMGHLFSNSGQRGVYRTTDGGTTWENVLFINDSTGVIDMAINPENPDTIFAAAWERVRRPSYRSYGGPSSGIYRSTDGGDNWTELTNGIPVSTNRIGLAISASEPNILYSLIGHPSDNDIEGIYKSTDHGDSWNAVSINGLSNPAFMWWFGRIYVDPTDSDNLYVASFDMHRSSNGGNSWSTIFDGAHVDQHAIYIHPSDPALVWAGNDGGLYASSNYGNGFVAIDNIPSIQFYTCEIDYSQPERLYGGTQDNNPMRTLSGAPDGWAQFWGGDGFYTLVDPTDNSYVYTESQYGNIARSINGGNSFFNATAGISGNDRKNWNTPIVFDPANPATLYTGTQRLYRSDNRAVSWAAISNDLTKGNASGNLTFGTITTISVSPLDPDVIYVGCDDGNVQATFDGGNSWDLISSSLPNRWVTRIVASAFDANQAFATFSGYRFGENIGHVYMTQDGGSTWLDISGNLPDIPVNCMVEVAATGALYIATDIGVFASVDLGQNWELLGTNLPNLVITDLDYHPPTEQLIAASYGRGMYKITLDSIPLTSTTKLSGLTTDLKAIPNPAIGKTRLVFELINSGNYTIRLFGPSGQLMKNVFKGPLSAGTHSQEVSLDGLPSGLYTCQLRSNQGGQQQIQLIKQ